MNDYRMHPRVYDAVKLVLRILFGIFLDCAIEGAKHVPPHGAVILMINHLSFLDPLTAALFVSRRVVMMSKKENFDIPIIGWIARLCGIFPIDREHPDVSSMRRTLKLLKAGEVVLIAPEGTRSKTRVLQRGHDGLAWVAARTGATIVPVGVTGGERFFHNLKRLRRTHVKAVYGEPFNLAAAPRKVRSEELPQLTEIAMGRLAAVLPPEYRGVYA